MVNNDTQAFVHPEEYEANEEKIKDTCHCFYHLGLSQQAELVSLTLVEVQPAF